MSWTTSKLLAAKDAPSPARQNGKASLPQLARFEALEAIGEGGMSTVYKCRHRSTGEIVAVKLLSQEVARSPVLLKRFEQEFQVSRRLHHPNIVRMLDFGRDEAGPYLVMELVDGMSLGELIEREGALPEAEAVHLIAQVARGLEYAHTQGIIHRDIKPDNILLGTDGQAKLTDLGLVKLVNEDMNLTRPGQGLGTPNFMAPEQFSSAKTIDRRSDVYGLGATLYQAVTGTLPFEAESPIDILRKKALNELAPPRQLASAVSEPVERAILRAMSIAPGERPGSPAELVAELTGRRRRRAPACPAAEDPNGSATQPAQDKPPQNPSPQAVEPTKSVTSPSRSVTPSPAARRPRPAQARATPVYDWGISETWQWVFAGLLAVGAAAGFIVMHFLK
jgi:serine/threonine protein kinase